MPAATDEEALRRLVDRIATNEQTLRFPSFSHTDAFNIGVLLRDLFLTISSQPSSGALPATCECLCVPKRWRRFKQIWHSDFDRDIHRPPVSFCHVCMSARDQGNNLRDRRLFSAVAGNPEAVRPDNWRWVEGKKNIVRRFHRSSFYIGQKTRLSGYLSVRPTVRRKVESCA